MTTIDYGTIGNKIKQARLDKKLSQEQLAEACGISASFLGHIERGTRKMSLETFFDLCTVLKLSPSYLLLPMGTTIDSNVLTIDLNTLSTNNKEQKQAFVNAVQALLAGIDKL